MSEACFGGLRPATVAGGLAAAGAAPVGVARAAVPLVQCSASVSLTWLAGLRAESAPNRQKIVRATGWDPVWSAGVAAGWSRVVEQIDQARGVPAAPAPGHDLGVELIDQGGHR